jgi:hypothetical protein
VYTGFDVVQIIDFAGNNDILRAGSPLDLRQPCLTNGTYKRKILVRRILHPYKKPDGQEQPM